ncbi:phosphoesterase PA-phosphatase related protein [Emticicia oligotrophica DSM 17448]|uniref:Phosphoesterase PA-phosphatase related protein n=1 Tax=Emticicia oligotrophica (strain DSM 17448 / CIP 109782 / MTCC 6937 / GPTSA100-15) TaxID=929562 RepID=A0ABM5MYK1_EMTOG|nr:phosphatase PAP2 family protein [Emticicia oligotrophica]AFK02179.1 phosphoesterase PA-phosphatase related protein [Emticicia oligotrophica DSM 17448]
MPSHLFRTLLFVFISFQLSAQNFDIDILKNINQNRNTNFDKPLNLISKSVYPLSVALPISLLGTGFITKDKNLQRQGITSLASLAISMGTTYTLKKIINRNRPYITYPTLIQPYYIENDPAFPSGHTTAAFSTATSLSLTFKKWYVVVPAYTWAGAVAYSRLHLGVHYPSDVLAGAAIGAGSAWLCYKANRWLQRKK